MSISRGKLRRYYWEKSKGTQSNPEMEPLPQNWQKLMEYVGQLMSHIKTYDQQTYETRVEGDLIKIKV